MVEQHTGEGGDTVISDGFHVAELMRNEYPEEFNHLAEAIVYYSCSGVDTNSIENEEYHYDRINKASVFK